MGDLLLTDFLDKILENLKGTWVFEELKDLEILDFDFSPANDKLYLKAHKSYYSCELKLCLENGWVEYFQTHYHAGLDYQLFLELPLTQLNELRELLALSPLDQKKYWKPNGLYKEANNMVATVIVNELGATKVIQHCEYGSQLPWEKRPSFFSPRALIIAAHAPLALRITLYLILLFMVSFVGIVIIKLHSIPLLCAIIAAPLMAIALSFHYSVFKKKVLKGISPEKIVLETYYLGLRLRRKLFDRSLIHLQSGRHSVNGPKFQLNRAMYSIYLTDTKHSALVFESEIADEVLEEINNIQTFLEGAA